MRAEQGLIPRESDKVCALIREALDEFGLDASGGEIKAYADFLSNCLQKKYITFPTKGFIRGCVGNMIAWDTYKNWGFRQRR